MMSGLLFTSFLSTNFGINAKAWRLFADVAVDVGEWHARVQSNTNSALDRL